MVHQTDWSDGEVRAGVLELERIRRETDAAMALLIAALPESRDAVAELARSVGISNREARRRQNIAKVVKCVPGAIALLGSGAVSAEHIEALAPVASVAGADQLLVNASSKSPEEFIREVEQFRISLESGEEITKRQRARRLLRFYRGPEGMVGITGLLTPLDGTELKNKLAALVHARWKTEHPHRAESLGSHRGDTYEQRTADALLTLTGVRTSYETAKETTRQPSDVTAANDQRADSKSVDDGLAPFSSAVVSVHTAKPAVIILFDVDKWEAEIAGIGPIPVTTSLFDQVRSDLYYCFQTMTGEVLKFGRSRRNPTPVQRLAVIARDRHCIYPGCTSPPDACQVHHCDEVDEDNGNTDVDVLGLFCHAHHRHIHVNKLVVVRETDGSVTIRDRRTGAVVARSTKQARAA